VAVPLLKERAEYRRIGEVDFLLVVGNAAGYFWVVYVTLNAWHPLAAGPYALALAVIYRAAAADYAARVPDDQATVVLHEGLAWTFLTIAIPLALDGRWVTLAWAVQGVMLLWLAARLTTPVAAWGGLAVLLFAAVRVVFLDRYWYPDVTPVWNLTYLVHLLVVAALIAGGARAGGLRSPRLGHATALRIQSALWAVAAVVLAALFWREPRGLWPALLLAALVLVLGALARVSMSPAFVVATPLVAAILLARVFGVDDGLARAASASPVSRPLLSRVAACLAVAVAGSWLKRSDASPRAPMLGRLMSGAGGLERALVRAGELVADRPVVGRERGFDAVRDGEREVAAVPHVAVRAARVHLAAIERAAFHRVVPAVQEDAVAAVRGAAGDEHVVANPHAVVAGRGPQCGAGGGIEAGWKRREIEHPVTGKRPADIANVPGCVRAVVVKPLERRVVEHERHRGRG